MCDANVAFNLSFDLFEPDDGFLSKLDAEVCKHNGNVQTDSVEVIYSSQNNCKDFSAKEEIMSNTIMRKQEFYDLPLSIGDLSELKCNFKAKIEEQDSLKDSEESYVAEKSPIEKTFSICFSPTLSSLQGKDKPVSFSTPIRNDIKTCDSIKIKDEEKIIQETSQNFKDTNKNLGYVYADFDLFEEWDISHEVDNKHEESNTYITLSQALELIESTARAGELRKEVNMNVASTHSIGTVDLHSNVSKEDAKKENLFVDSFKLQSYEKKILESCLKRSPDSIDVHSANEFDHNKSVIIVAENSTQGVQNCQSARRKPRAAEKLFFDEEKTSSNYSEEVRSESKINCDKIEFDHDDTFPQLSFFDKLEKEEAEKLLLNKCSKLEEYSSQNNFGNIEESMKLPSESNNSVEFGNSFNFPKKKGNFVRINETSCEEGNPNHKHYKKKRKSKVPSTTEFIDFEAEVSFGVDEVSSDESDSDEDNYEKSFVDDESYCTQNASTDMTAKYLESIKASNNRIGTFKIPNNLPPINENIYSQAIPDTNSDYEINSFCVEDVEYDENEISILEIAEQVLEIKKRNRRKTRKSNSKRKKRS